MGRALRIGVDASCWANGRGYGRFTQELLRAMVEMAPEHTFVCFVDSAVERMWDLVSPNVSLVRVPQSAMPTDAASAVGNRGPADICIDAGDHDAGDGCTERIAV